MREEELQEGCWCGPVVEVLPRPVLTARRSPSSVLVREDCTVVFRCLGRGRTPVATVRAEDGQQRNIGIASRAANNLSTRSHIMILGEGLFVEGLWRRSGLLLGKLLLLFWRKIFEENFSCCFGEKSSENVNDHNLGPYGKDHGVTRFKFFGKNTPWD